MGCIVSSDYLLEVVKKKFFHAGGCFTQAHWVNREVATVLVIFCLPVSGDFCLTYRDVPNNTIHALQLTDEKLEEQQRLCHNTDKAMDVLRSLVEHMTQNRVNIEVSSDAASVEYEVGRKRSKMMFVLPALAVNSERLQRLLLQPLSRAKRSNEVSQIERSLRENSHTETSAEPPAKAAPQSDDEQRPHTPVVNRPTSGFKERGHPPAVPWQPAMSVEESATQFHVRVDLPGVSKEDVSINVTSTQVTVRGTRNHEHQEGVQTLVTERRGGEFERCYTLPSRAREAGNSATFTDGVLTVVIDKDTDTARPCGNVSIS